MNKTKIKIPVLLVSAAISAIISPVVYSADSKSVMQMPDFYLNQDKYPERVVYSSDGEALNWKKFPKNKSGSTKASCEATQGKYSKECYQLNVGRLLNDKKWSRNKNYFEVSRIVDDIEKQISEMGDGSTPYESGFAAGSIPSNFAPWWTKVVAEPISTKTDGVQQDITSLIEKAIVHSAQIKVFSDVPIIRETAIYEAKGDFDPVGYFDYRWTDIDDPVGSTLTTGGDGRFLET